MPPDTPHQGVTKWALGNPKDPGLHHSGVTGLWNDAQKYMEVEIPAGEIITVGFVARQGDAASSYIGCMSQIWIPYEVQAKMSWNGVVKTWDAATGTYK